MGEITTFTNNFLQIKMTEDEDSIRLAWSGKSVDREPGKFISPILLEMKKESLVEPNGKLSATTSSEKCVSSPHSVNRPNRSQ